MTRFSFILPKHELVIFWSPKAACSSLTDAVAKSLFGPDIFHELRDKNQSVRQMLKHHGFMQTGPDGYRAVRRRGYHSMALLRDPYDRLISAYINKFVCARGTSMRRFRDLGPVAYNFVCEKFSSVEIPHSTQ